MKAGGLASKLIMFHVEAHGCLGIGPACNSGRASAAREPKKDASELTVEAIWPLAPGGPFEKLFHKKGNSTHENSGFRHQCLM